MRSFDTICDLMSHLQKDLTPNLMQNARFYVRFIALNDVSVLADFKSYMHKTGIRVLNISDIARPLSYSPDKIISVDDILNWIKSQKCSICLTGLSQYSRLLNNEDFDAFFSDLATLEGPTNSRFRVYLPLVDIRGRLITSWQKLHRSNGEREPIWELTESKQAKQSCCVFYNGIRTGISQVNCVSDFSSWVNEVYSDDVYVCTSACLNSTKKRAKSGDKYIFIYPRNTSETFSSIFPSTEFDDWEYQGIEDEHWKTLVESYTGPSCRGFIYNRFNIKAFTSDVFVQLYKKSKTAFDKWLLRKYVLYCAGEDCQYLKFAVAELDELEKNRCWVGAVDIIRIFYTKILQIEDRSDKLLEERRELILACKDFGYVANGCDDLKKEILPYIRNCTPQDFSQIHVGLFPFEDEIILAYYKNGTIEYEVIAGMSQALHRYTEASSVSHLIKYSGDWEYNYFCAYREAKLKDEVSSKLSALLHVQNKNTADFWRWWYTLPTTHSLLDSSPKDVAVVWADGLGIEWAPYIVNTIRDEYKGVSVEVCAARNNLPTNTSLNAFSGVEKLEDLDNEYHDGIYRYPQSILREITAVQQIIKTACSKLKQYQTTIIVSDHGATALARCSDSIKLDIEASHEGRYCCLSDERQDDPFGVFYRNEDDGKLYYVAKLHNSLTKKPVREVHGGCTPEEVIVPFIVLSRSEQSQEKIYKVTYKDSIIYTLSPFIELSICPTPRLMPRFELDGKPIVGKVLKGGTYEINCAGVEPGQHSVVAFIDESIVCCGDIHIVTKTFEEDNLGFDD